jgi:hypothetical protein
MPSSYRVPEEMAHFSPQGKTKSTPRRSQLSWLAVVSGGVQISPGILLAFSSNGIDDKPCLLHEDWELQMEAQSSMDMRLERSEQRCCIRRLEAVIKQLAIFVEAPPLQRLAVSLFVAPPQTLPSDRFVQNLDAHERKNLPSQSVFRQLRIAIADLVVNDIVRIREDLEIFFVRRKMRRPVDIGELQAWDPEVSKFREWHVQGRERRAWTSSARASLEISGYHVWRCEDYPRQLRTDSVECWLKSCLCSLQKPKVCSRNPIGERKQKSPSTPLRLSKFAANATLYH